MIAVTARPVAVSGALVCIAALTSCVGLRPMNSASDRGGWPPLAPATLGDARTANQVLRVAHGEREMTLNCVVAVDAKQLTIVGMTALGLRAFTIRYDGVRVSAEAQPGVPQSMPPERLLNDVQLAYWPLAALQKALANSPWDVSEAAPGTRRLKRDGRIVAEVHYASGAERAWQSRVWLVNLEFGYTLNIESQLLAGDAQ